MLARISLGKNQRCINIDLCLFATSWLRSCAVQCVYIWYNNRTASLAATLPAVIYLLAGLTHKHSFGK